MFKPFHSPAVLASCLLCILAVPVIQAASAPQPDPIYVWKPNDVLRFDYLKSVHIDEKSTDIDPGPRDFSFDAVLIMEINKNKTTAGTFGVLHFDSPHIVMPENYLFAPTADDPALQKDKMKAIVLALQGAIKNARWTVIVDGSGVMHIDSRLPKVLDDWLHETERTAYWKAKFRKLWVELIENNLGLAATGDDRDLFLALTPPPDPAGIEGDTIRTRRSIVHLDSNQGGKADFSFKRLAPPKAGQGYKVPSLDKPNVMMTLNPLLKGPASESEPDGAAAQIGVAVFDTRLGMLDSIDEQYSFEARYSCDEDSTHKYSLTQRVTVKYALKRLAPPVTERSDPALDALKSK